jgi:isopenicillin N synthase-like dioxygenase
MPVPVINLGAEPASALAGRIDAALDLPGGHFNTGLRHPTCTTRLLHYPPIAAGRHLEDMYRKTTVAA